MENATMKQLTLFSISVVLAASNCLFSSSTLLADEPATLSIATAKAPDEVAEPIRAALDDKVLRLSSGDKPFFEFWFRKQLPLAKQPADGTLGLETIAEGTVLGVLRVNEERRDFRDEELPKGVYIVRLGIQPEDGNHQGVAPTRTFALLILAKTDTKLDPLPHKELLKAAATINAAHHPSNLNLQPVEKLDGQFPRLEERNDGKHQVVLLKLPAHVGETGPATTLTFALVYAGTGQI
jgi:hypothetical protein